jgi:hypothetical protein
MTDVQTIGLAYEPRVWGRKLHALMASTRFVVALAHRRAGKTWVAVAALSLAAIALPGTRYGYVAPTQVQAKRITWAVLKTILAPIPNVDFRESELRIIFPNGSEIALYSGEQHDRMRGLGLHGVVIDEVAQLPIEAWYSSIRPTLSGTNGWALFIGTPAGADLLAELAQYAMSGADRNWAFASFPAWPENTTGVLPAEEIEAARREALSEGTFLREYGVRLDVSADDQLIRLEDVLACQQRVAPPNARQTLALRNEPRIIGVDVSGPSADGDNSVIVRRIGPVVLDPIVVPSAQYETLAARIAAAIREIDADACFIDGTGGWALGVIPALQNLGYIINPVSFSSSALKDDQYANRRAEMHAELARWTRLPTSILPKGQRLAADLTATRFKHDARGRVQLEPKSEVRKRLGRSPDIADALAVSFAIPVLGRERTFDTTSPGDRLRAGGGHYNRQQRRQPYVYDPFGDSA